MLRAQTTTRPGAAWTVSQLPAGGTALEWPVPPTGARDPGQTPWSLSLGEFSCPEQVSFLTSLRRTVPRWLRRRLTTLEVTAPRGGLAVQLVVACVLRVAGSLPRHRAVVVHPVREALSARATPGGGSWAVAPAADEVLKVSVKLGAVTVPAAGGAGGPTSGRVVVVAVAAGPGDALPASHACAWTALAAAPGTGPVASKAGQSAAGESGDCESAAVPCPAGGAGLWGVSGGAARQAEQLRSGLPPRAARALVALGDALGEATLLATVAAHGPAHGGGGGAAHDTDPLLHPALLGLLGYLLDVLSSLPVLVARGAVAPDTAGAVYELGWGRLLGVAGVAAAGRSALGALVHAEVLVAARTLADLAQTHPQRVLALAGGLMNAVITHPVALRAGVARDPPVMARQRLLWLAELGRSLSAWPTPAPAGPGAFQTARDVLVLHYLTALCHHPGAALLVAQRTPAAVGCLCWPRPGPCC